MQSDLTCPLIGTSNSQTKSERLFLVPRPTFTNKSSAVAEMGDRLATIGMGRRFEGLLWGLGPHLTQCGLGRGLPLYQVAS